MMAYISWLQMTAAVALVFVNNDHRPLAEIHPTGWPPVQLIRLMVSIRKLLSGINLTLPNRLWFVIPAKAGIQKWGFSAEHK